MRSVLIERAGFFWPPAFAEVLPARLVEALDAYSLPAAASELCLRVGRRATVSHGATSVRLDVVLSRAELAEILSRLAGGSLYAHEGTLREGFLTWEGIRVGVAGEMVLERGQVLGFSAVTSLVFRIPHRVEVDVSFLTPLMEGIFPRGVLVFSPPGGGKTTFLRAAVRHLASGVGPRRVAVADSRREFSFGLESPDLTVDILSGCPKAEGIEMAVRCLAAEVVVCDELGPAESEAVFGLQGGGVPLLASAHAASIEGLLARPDMARFHAAGVFGAYIRVDGGKKPTVYRREDMV